MVRDHVAQVRLPLEQVRREVADVERLDVRGVEALVHRLDRLGVGVRHQVPGALVREGAEPGYGAADYRYAPPEFPGCHVNLA